MKIPFHIKILLNTLNVKGLDLSSRLKVFLILIRKIFRLVIRKNSSVNVSCIKKGSKNFYKHCIYQEEVKKSIFSAGIGIKDAKIISKSHRSSH